MSKAVDIPEAAQKTGSVFDMLLAVETLKDCQTVKAIPYLARIDRQSTGWIRIILFGGIRLVFFLLLLMIFTLLWSRILPNGIDLFVQFVLTNPPGNWGEYIPIGVGESNPQTYPTLRFLMVFITSLVLFRSVGLRKILKGYDLWGKPGLPSRLTRILLQTIRFYSQGMVILALAFFVILSLLPFLLLALELIANLNGDSLQSQALWTPLREFWRLEILALIGAVWLLYLMVRNHRQFFIRLSLIVFGGLGLVDLVWSAYSRGVPQYVIAIGLGCILAYPLGLAMGIARVFFIPFRIFRDTLFWISQRIALRLQTGRALRYHRQRNREKVARDAWAAVCRDHCRRLETHSDWLSYWRKISYAWCPICQDDNSVYTGVECLALQFDQRMRESAKHVNTVLWLNGLEWRRNAQRGVFPVFDAIVVGLVPEHELEAFVTAYTSQPMTAPLKNLKEVTVQISKGCTLPPNEIKILKANVGQLLFEYDVSELPNPCTGNTRVKEAVKHRARQVKQLTRKIAGVGAILSLLALVSFVAFLTWPGIASFLHVRAVEPTVTSNPTRVLLIEVVVTPSAARPAEVEPTSTNGPAREWISPIDGAASILIPAGMFMMGEPKSEIPQHEVYLGAYYIDKFEITNDQYWKCINDGQCDPPQSFASQTSSNYFENPKFGKHPVIKVTWFDALAYCTWAGRRLPTEAEWEKAARWDPAADKSYRYPWGNGPPDEQHANFNQLVGDTTPTGVYDAGRSPAGLYDMAGNVWEWVSDWYATDTFSDAPQENPVGPQNGYYKVMRGGSWISDGQEIYATIRKKYAPQESRYDMGFRCAKNAEP